MKRKTLIALIALLAALCLGCVTACAPQNGNDVPPSVETPGETPGEDDPNKTPGETPGEDDPTEPPGETPGETPGEDDPTEPPEEEEPEEDPSVPKHNWGEWKTLSEPTCGRSGTKTRQCRDCGEVETVPILATLDHVGGEWQSDAGSHWKVCTKCGAPFWIDPHDGYPCSICGYDVTEASVGLSFEENETQDGYLVSGRGECGDSIIVIPAEYEDKPVVGITDGAFTVDKNLKQIIIPEGVKTIGNGAFGMSGLTEIELPSTITSIGSDAFFDCTSLQRVVLSEGIETVSEGCFSGCSNLSEVVLPASLKTVKARAFEYCTSLTDIRFAGDSAQWGNVTKEETWNEGAGECTVTYSYKENA